MFKGIQNFFASIIRPFKNNVPLLYMAAGGGLVFFGSLAATWIDGLPFVFKGTAGSIVTIGTTIIGAGVFAAVLKSAQFSEIFQKHIHSVFYSPELAVELEENKKKWKKLTDAIFSKCLTGVHGEATEKLSEIFFTSDLDYHFENMEVNYRVILDNKRNLKVRYHSKSTIVVAPDAEPIIWQRLSKGGGTQLVSLIVNEESVCPDGLLKDNPDNADELSFQLPFEKYSSFDSFKKDRSFTLERTLEYTQDIFKEPYMVAGLSRFVSGLTVSVKAIDCNIHFTGTGSGVLDCPTPVADGAGYRRWVLAKKGNLLLPGQGYIIIVTS